MYTMMVRTNIYLNKNQIDFLKTLNDLSISEHIRRALDIYIDSFKIKSSASLSLKGKYE
jgi:hypothetical protein